MPEVRETYGAILSVDMAATLLPLMTEMLSEESPSYVHDLVEQMAPVEPTAGYVKAFARLVELEQAAAWWHERRSITLAPVAPATAPPLGKGFTTIDGQPTAPGGKLTLCTYANALGLPAASVPVMRSADGLPIGVQVIGPRGRDHLVIAAARKLEEAFGGWIEAEAAPAVREPGHQ